jgi:hypothetical protein
MKIILFILLLGITSHAKEVRIGIIDTGFDLTKVPNTVRLCSGTKVFNTSFSKSMADVIGHGTTVLRYVESKVHPTISHCYVLVKIFHNYDKTIVDKQDKTRYTNIVEALTILKDNKVDIINLSYGGYVPLIKERKLILSLLDSNIVLVAAAGNAKVNLDEKCNFYPGCYDKRIVLVGDKAETDSNYGKPVDLIYNGKGEACPAEKDCVVDWGTSYSTARITGLMVNKFEKFTNLINRK